MTIQAMFSGRIYKVLEVLPGTKEGDPGTIKCTRNGEDCVIKINPHIYKEMK